MAYVSPTWNTTNANVKYQVVADLISQDVNTLSSVVRVRLEAWRTNSYTTYGSGGGFVYVDGTEYGDEIVPEQEISYYSYTILSDEWVTIYHNSDGTKNLTCGGYFYINSPVEGGWNYYSFDLPQIIIPPRTVDITIDTGIVESNSTQKGAISSALTESLGDIMELTPKAYKQKTVLATINDLQNLWVAGEVATGSVVTLNKFGVWTVGSYANGTTAALDNQGNLTATDLTEAEGN